MSEVICMTDDASHPVSFDSHVSLETWETVLTLKWDKKKLFHLSAIVGLFHYIVIQGICLFPTKSLWNGLFSSFHWGTY